MSDVIEKVKDAARRNAAQRAQMLKELRQRQRAEAQVLFKEGTAELFAAHPKLESFGWTQYTPYFNDGDECVFSVHNDDLAINGAGRYENSALNEERYVPDESQQPDRWGHRPHKKVPNADFDPALKAAHDAAVEFLQCFDWDDFKELFGDHVQITVHRSGLVEVDEHEHE